MRNASKRYTTRQARKTPQRIRTLSNCEVATNSKSDYMALDMTNWTFCLRVDAISTLSTMVVKQKEIFFKMYCGQLPSMASNIIWYCWLQVINLTRMLCVYVCNVCKTLFQHAIFVNYLHQLVSTKGVLCTLNLKYITRHTLIKLLITNINLS